MLGGLVMSFRTVVGSHVCFSISPDTPCPCGTEKDAGRCCLTRSGFVKKAAGCSPPPPKTGRKNDGCYAAILGDCSPKLSREHFISASLLEYLNESKSLRVSGLPWLKGKEKVLPPAAIAGRILCERHNSALSQLDSIAVKLFRALDEEGVAGSGKQLMYLFSGHDIERWILKIVAGLQYSTGTGVPGECDRSVPEAWVRVLFSEADFSNDCGLFICKVPGHRFSGPRGLLIQAIASRGAVAGVGVSVCGYELVLSLAGFRNRQFDGRSFAYRPLELYAAGERFEKSVIFSWSGHADLGTISVTIPT
jgi:hypothetical protein